MVHRHIIKLTFLYDNGNDETLIRISLPEWENFPGMKRKIREAHAFLDSDKDQNGIYENNGRNYESLMNYVCEKYHWHWDVFKQATEIILE